MQPAYDLRNLNSEIGGFQEQGSRFEKGHNKTSEIHSDLAVRRDSLDRPCGWSAECSGR
jgi:hypothetical protein